MRSDGMMAEKPGRQRDRGEQRFQMARRHGDDEPPDLAGGDLRQLVGQRLVVPIWLERRIRSYHAEGIIGEGHEIEHAVPHAGRRSADSRLQSGNSIVIACSPSASSAASSSISPARLSLERATAEAWTYQHRTPLDRAFAEAGCCFTSML